MLSLTKAHWVTRFYGNGNNDMEGDTWPHCLGRVQNTHLFSPQLPPRVNYKLSYKHTQFRMNTKRALLLWLVGVLTASLSTINSIW